MTDLIKSTVKCYKKKTKKMVGGHRKTYEYNQYQVPLKKSDNLNCSDEVFIIPQSNFEELMEDGLDSQKEKINQKNSIIASYEKELADLEWKHGELSRSYKSLVSKNAKTNKQIKTEKEKAELYETLNTALKKENLKLLKQLEQIKKEHYDLKETLEDHETDIKKDQDIWKSIRSRFSSKEMKDKQDKDD
ncbi:MAG: hypothetical protein LLF83_09670 [Methanobacterium sp.]|nr:hypothetical protein [Methanobacterium sp.]